MPPSPSALPAALMSSAALIAAGVGLTWLALRLARRLVTGAAPRALAALLLATAMAAAAVATVASVGRLGRAPLLLFVAALVALVALAGRARRRKPRDPAAVELPGVASEPSGPLVFGGGLFAAIVLLLGPEPPVSWDALTYHVYLPARWVQEGHLLHLATVFGDDAAAWAPQQAALVYAAALALHGDDLLVDVLGLLWLATAAVAVAVLARSLGAGARSSSLAGLLTCWQAPLLAAATAATADALLAGAWVGGLAMLACASRAPRPDGAILAAAVAAGLAAGSKTVGLPLGVALAVLAILAALARRRQATALAVPALALAGGGWWYLRNALSTGNPVFPLAVDLGGIHLAGPFGREALAAGEFHAPPGAALEVLCRSWGTGTLLLGLAGLGGLALAAGRALQARPRDALWPVALLSLALGWLLFFLLVIPHNLESRLALPALVAALPGLGPLLDGLRPRSSVWGAAALGCLAAVPQLVAWAGPARRLVTAGAPAAAWLCAAGVALLLLARATRTGAARRRLLGVAAAGAAVLALPLGARAGLAVRAPALAASDIAPWSSVFVPFNEPGRRWAVRTVAYTGANVPYALVGPGLLRRVVYAEVQGELGSSLFDHWRERPVRFAYHKTGVWRDRPDPGTWWRNLRRSRAELLVTMRLHPVEARYLDPGGGGQPIEERWAQERPDRFTLLARSAAGSVWRVAGEDEASSAAGDGPARGER